MGTNHTNPHLSERVRDLFSRGLVRRAMQVARLERMALHLGVDEQAVIRSYGLPPLPPALGQVVYLVGHARNPADGEPVKIGYTRQELRDRREALQPGSVQQLYLIAYRPGGLSLERAIHHRLMDLRIREDWFEMHDAIREEFGLGPALTGSGSDAWGTGETVSFTPAPDLPEGAS